ncbi:MAG: nucleotide pyrophosphohydrolase [Candidatus Helarchaeota archaeon]
MAQKTSDNLIFLRKKIANFINERNWGKLRTPKDLSIAISIESAELLENFLFRQLSVGEITKNIELFRKIKEEMADILIYLLSLNIILDFDLGTAVLEKIEKNREKYPISKYKL